jgi:hypothetical protein
MKYLPLIPLILSIIYILIGVYKGTREDPDHNAAFANTLFASLALSVSYVTLFYIHLHNLPDN